MSKQELGVNPIIDTKIMMDLLALQHVVSPLRSPLIAKISIGKESPSKVV